MEYYYQSPVGMLKITANDAALTALQLVTNDPCESDPQAASNPVIRQTCKQLDEYFAGKRQGFELPLAPQGTPFQQRVWDALQNIPYGKTISCAIGYHGR